MARGTATSSSRRRPAVAMWRRRLALDRLEGLPDAPRAGVLRRIDAEAVEHPIVPTLEEMAANAVHWSTRSMARRAGMSQTAMSRIWRAFACSRTEQRRSSSRPIRFVEKSLPPDLIRGS